MKAKLNGIIEIHEEPYFRKMKVESGWMYNFWDRVKDEYANEWIFVPESSDRMRKLEHHETTTVGLWATDRPDLIVDSKNIMFQITKA